MKLFFLAEDHKLNTIISGSAHGTKIEKSLVFQKPADLKTGGNRIAILGVTVGMPVTMKPQ